MLGAGGGTEDTFLWRALALQAAGDTAEARAVLETFLAEHDDLPELTGKAKDTLTRL